MIHGIIDIGSNTIRMAIYDIKGQQIDFLIKWEPHTRDFSRELGDQASQRIQKYVRRDRCSKSIQYYSNCWKLLKIAELQRKDETSLDVNVAKAEKICYMA